VHDAPSRPLDDGQRVQCQPPRLRVGVVSVQQSTELAATLVVAAEEPEPAQRPVQPLAQRNAAGGGAPVGPRAGVLLLDQSASRGSLAGAVQRRRTLSRLDQHPGRVTGRDRVRLSRRSQVLERVVADGLEQPERPASATTSERSTRPVSRPSTAAGSSVASAQTPFAASSVQRLRNTDNRRSSTRSTNRTSSPSVPPSKRLATSNASDVLPAPPEPVMVNRRTSSNCPSTSPMSASRSTSGVTRSGSRVGGWGIRRTLEDAHVADEAVPPDHAPCG
jgi:hypothetical protein